MSVRTDKFHFKKGALDCSVSLFDLEKAESASPFPSHHAVRGRGDTSHSFAVASVQWYPMVSRNYGFFFSRLVWRHV